MKERITPFLAISKIVLHRNEYEMMRKSIFVGKTDLKVEKRQVVGNYVDLKGEKFYKISNYDQMAPFSWAL